jgi:hypothetical protein
VDGEKWDQTKQASSEAAQAASHKAVEAKDSAGGLLQQAGNAVSNAYQSVKEAVTPKQQTGNVVETGYGWRVGSCVDVYNVQRGDSIG